LSAIAAGAAALPNVGVCILLIIIGLALNPEVRSFLQD